MTTRARRLPHYTQWAGQFYVAAELSRREYIVTFTFGNAPKTDLQATSPSGKSFRLECKSAKTRSSWFISEPEKIPVSKDLFYVLIYVPKADDVSPRFFIVPSKIMQKTVQEVKSDALARGVPSAKTWKGYGPKFSAFEDEYENAWDILPQ